MTDYSMLCKQLSALSEDNPHRIAKLANASALLYASLDRLNWAGFYFLEQNELVLGPFQGKPACIVLKPGRGVCGTAAAEDRTIVVPDVHAFSGHIACDSASRSEIVIPLHQNGAVIGVLDIDSPFPDRFSDTDRAGLEQFAAVLEQSLQEDVQSAN